MKLLTWWNRYWFNSAPLFNLGVCRIVIVGFLLYHWMVHPPFAFFQSLARLPDFLYDPPVLFRLLTLPLGWNFRPSLEGLEAIYWISLFAGVCAFIGFKSNWSLLAFALGNFIMVSFSYSFGEIHHPQALMVISLFALAMSPIGKSLSIDDLRSKMYQSSQKQKFENYQVLEERNCFAQWSLLLTQWLLALAYFSAFISKLGRSGLDWANGYTLQYFLLQDGLRWNSEPAMWLGQFHTVAWLLQWATLFFQGTFFLVVLFPLFSWFYVPMGLAFHTGVYLTIGAPFFHWMFLYVVFIPWTAVTRWILQKWIHVQGNRRLEVLFDGHCPLCIRSMTQLRYFDWFDRVIYSDVTQRWSTLAEAHPERSLEDYLHEMYLLLPDGSEVQGFYAFRKLLWHIPPLWPGLIVFYLPFSSVLGPKIYKRIASSRQRFSRCTVASCSVGETHKPRFP